MALCRCENHPPRNNRTKIYNHQVEPLGYPQTSSICGGNGCRRPGLIRLTDEEFQLFEGGEDIFKYDHNCTKVRVKNPNRKG